MSTATTPEARGPEVVMSPQRAGAAIPTALSFSRSLLRKMVRERWRILPAFVELDQDGRGQALYRIETPGAAYHYFVVSDVFPDDQKIDRAFGINWDVSAALCEGEWTADRQAFLAVEVPKQYDGRYPSDVLCFCRGNRSERVFDHVVDALAAGSQPDTALLASVGYLLRSTAFAGNGLFGMKPFEALAGDEALGATYHAQILAAYMLRIFVFDLAEHIAAARSPSAVKLDPAVKRYLGLGNSAGLGLVPFLMNHPHIVHQWCKAQEDAFAAALARDADEGDLARFHQLVGRAGRYFREDRRDGNGIFADYEVLARDFDAVLAAFASLPAGGARTWRDVLCTLLPEGAHPETEEALLSLILELHPDIVAEAEQRLVADESQDIDPCMSVGDLIRLTRERYDWLSVPAGSGAAAHFWYYPQESPYEPRRGIRSGTTRFEAETPMDVARLVPEMLDALLSEPPDTPVGLFTARRPEFALTVRRVQSLAALPYAELRVNSLSDDFLPFAACRFLLAFYGMEKFDPRPPRATKGALLQGAPLPEDIARGEDGDWPFPLAPQFAEPTESGFVPQRLVERPEIAIESLKPRSYGNADRANDAVTVFPAEMRKLLSRAAIGAELGAAAGDAAMRLALTMGCGWLEATLDAIEECPHPRPALQGNVIAGGGLPDFAVLPAVLDLAGALSRDAAGMAIGTDMRPTPLMRGLSLWGAGRGFLTAVAEIDGGALHIAGGCDGEIWRLACREDPEGWIAAHAPAPLADWLAPVLELLRQSGDFRGRGGIAVRCTALPMSWRAAERLLPPASGSVEASSPDRVNAIREGHLLTGFSLSGPGFRRLSAMAKQGLVSPALEPTLAGRPTVAA